MELKAAEPMWAEMIPPKALAAYHERVIFDACKWDPQVGDDNTIANFAIYLSDPAVSELAHLAEALDRELDEAAAAMWSAPEIFGELGMPRAVTTALRDLARAGPLPAGLSLRRYDFHPTPEGWRISEVNADVPGGYAEASLLPKLAVEVGLAGQPANSVTDHLLDALAAGLQGHPPGVIALVHATAYADDRQVMTFLERVLARADREGFSVAPDHLEWSDGHPRCATLRGRPVAAVMRFFPVEWFPALPRASGWHNLLGGRAVAPLLCTPGAMAIVQSKRAPLVWRRLGLRLPTWERLLPECAEPDSRADAAWLHKPAFGRVGGDIVAPAWGSSPGDRARLRSIRWFPRRWLRQRCFETSTLQLPDGRRVYPCLGVFVINGRFAGIYARTGSGPLIDHRAMDTPVLVAAPVASPSSPFPQLSSIS